MHHSRHHQSRVAWVAGGAGGGVWRTGNNQGSPSISARSLPYSTTLCSGGPPLLSRAFCSNYAQNGQLLSPAAAATAPSLSIKGGSEGGLFTVVASDPTRLIPPTPSSAWALPGCVVWA